VPSGIPSANAAPSTPSTSVRHLANVPFVPREFRGAWVSPLSDGRHADWPSSPYISADSQKKELTALLDHAKALHLNAIVLHVRTAADALYRSSTVPWSAFLTGTSGKDPGYDPLAYAVEQAHARGLQLHAWFNPFRAMLPNFAGRAAPNHVTRTHPDWIRRYGTQTWIDPGIPAARRAVLDAIVDVVTRYDIDGVHLDDYFYPYRESETITKRVHHRRVRIHRDIESPDSKTFAKYGAGWSDRAAWRRANIDTFIHDLYHSVKTVKPWVVVGISPFGIWRSGVPSGITGLDAYGEIYADSRQWLQKGWMDYIAPQLYWPLDGDQHRFAVLGAWWYTQNDQSRYIWPGIATMNVHSGRWSASEISAEIDTLRAQAAAASMPPGHIHFRMGSFDDMEFPANWSQATYPTDALVPAFPWLDARVPAAPYAVDLDSVFVPGHVLRRIVLSAGDTTPIAWWLVQRQTRDGVWHHTLVRASSVTVVPTADTIDIFDPALDRRQRQRVVISAVSRTGMVGMATRPN
jgi:uncharacterized lipoprotein YddW (UPF0748 family)